MLGQSSHGSRWICSWLMGSPFSMQVTSGSISCLQLVQLGLVPVSLLVVWICEPKYVTLQHELIINEMCDA